MSIHIDLNNQIASPGANSLIDPTLPASFQAAAQAGLSVNDNQNNTGRYVITAMTGCEGSASMGSGHAHGYMLKITDTQTGSSVEVFGDPHLYTSAGDMADFQQDGLVLNLGDGTIVQIDPTAVNGNGVAHIGAVAVTKDGKMVILTGFDTGAIHTSGVTQGRASSAQGFNNVNDTVLNAAPNGGLGTLTNDYGAQLNSKTYQDALDGMGGGYTEFADTSAELAMRAYSNALAINSGSPSGPNAASTSSGTTTPQTTPASSNPTMGPAAGISPIEIQAMLAYANGTGPQVNFADFNQTGSASTGGGIPVSNTSPQVEFASTNQTA